MNDKFTARQRAIILRLTGRPVQDICRALGRTSANLNSDPSTAAYRTEARKLPVHEAHGGSTPSHVCSRNRWH